MSARRKDVFGMLPYDKSSIEKNLIKNGFNKIAGVDEVGRGCLAGPVVAASVILPVCCNLEGIDDSKKLSPKKREYFYDKIVDIATSFGVGIVDSVAIDRINILRASLEAMKIAVSGMKVTPDYLLVDGIFPVDIKIKQEAIKRGDSLSMTIAAASIIAKVTRDRMMKELESKFPQFSFSIHKGYGTKMHVAELAKHGPTSIHRLTFRGVKPVSD